VLRSLQLLKERGQRLELPPDRRWRKMPALKALPPGNHGGSDDGAECLGADSARKRAAVGDVELVGQAGLLVGEVGKPPEHGWDVGEANEIGQLSKLGIPG